MHDIIMRLGLKKVGVIAQQIILMNSLVKIKETSFDLRRFWEHSVGCALIDDAASRVVEAAGNLVHGVPSDLRIVGGQHVLTMASTSVVTQNSNSFR